MTPKFDTSGRVRRGVITPRGTFSFRPGFVRWPSLSPFTQGCVEAMFAQHGEDLWRSRDPSPPSHSRPYGFSDLAPETLARIMEDCAAIWNSPIFGKVAAAYIAGDFAPGPEQQGRDFWRIRNGSEPEDASSYARGFQPRELAKLFATFPPLTPYLGDDGKVRLS